MKNKINTIIIAVTALLLSSVYILQYELFFYASKRLPYSGSITCNTNINMIIFMKLNQILRSNSGNLKNVTIHHPSNR